MKNNKIKDTLISTFTNIDECVICKRKIEKDKTERNGMCCKCDSTWTFKYKVGDPVEYKGEIWDIRGRLVVELKGEDIFINQYFVQRDENYKYVFEGELGREGLKIKEASCPKCGEIIDYKKEHTNNVTCLKCGHWFWVDEYK